MLVSRRHISAGGGFAGRFSFHFGVGGQFDVAFDGHLNGVGLAPVAAAAAVGAGNVHVGEELHVQGNLPRAVAGGAAQGSGVVGERARLQSLFLGVRQGGEGAAQIVQHAGVGAHGGAYVHADGRGVHQIDPRDARSVHGQHMPRQRRAGQRCLQPRDQAF